MTTPPPPMDQTARAADLRAALDAHAPADAHERASVERIAALLEREAEPFSRSTRVGHVTASAFVLDAAGERAAMIRHRKLGKRLQPGGHVEPAVDATHLQAVLREVLEETGLGAGEVDVLEPVFDVDVHAIPARGDVPAHEHHDVRALLRARPGADGRVAHDPQESDGIAWVPLEELLGDEESVARMARKARARGG